MLFPSGNIKLRRDALGNAISDVQLWIICVISQNYRPDIRCRVTSWPGCLKARDVQPASAFCHSAKLSVCVSRMCSVSLYYQRKIGNKKEKEKKTRSRHVEGHLTNLRRDESSSQYRQCFLPAHALSRAGIHTVCAWSAWGWARRVGFLRGPAALHFERFPLRTLRSRRALFEEGVFASTPQHSWGS